ncbi:uridylate kinase [uncultured Hyphomicrobium sp.]|uniref:amino acid kinase family protein n=1 Tax=uncultured Hyphomicrobium sp. TaxID=194373 RepID=UPI0025CD6D87|nr:uridylate kinase [uncultured Hyphomicrobium sp.]
MTPVVLKLGGSLAESGRLRVLLALVARARRPVVVVPGGGAFADAVRETQAALGFSDETAHDMALLAMHQMADAMIALEPRLLGAETLEGFARAWRRNRIPVWLPASLCAGDRRIPRDWSITSDGLAARLAERLGDAELVLVKSRRVRRTAPASTLARQGIVDPVFPVIVERAGLAWRVLGRGDDATLSQLLDVVARRGYRTSTRRSTVTRLTAPAAHATRVTKVR